MATTTTIAMLKMCQTCLKPGKFFFNTLLIFQYDYRLYMGSTATASTMHLTTAKTAAGEAFVWPGQQGVATVSGV